MDKEALLYHYFSNGLTPEQEQLLQGLLAKDSEFKEQFDLETDLREAIRDKESKNLKTKLAGFEEARKNNIPVRQLPKEDIRKSPRSNFRKWALAASVALLIGLGWLGFNQMGTDYPSLYGDNFEVYPNTVVTITRGDSGAGEERDAFVAYESGEYARAAALLEKLKVSMYEPYLDFYLGQCYLKLNDPTKALPYLKTATSENSEFRAEAHWYLALAYLKLEDGANAQMQLKQLTDNFNYNRHQAEMLLKELD